MNIMLILCAQKKFLFTHLIIPSFSALQAHGTIFSLNRRFSSAGTAEFLPEDAEIRARPCCNSRYRKRTQPASSPDNFHEIRISYFHPFSKFSASLIF